MNTIIQSGEIDDRKSEVNAFVENAGMNVTANYQVNIIAIDNFCIYHFREGDNRRDTCNIKLKFRPCWFSHSKDMQSRIWLITNK